MWKTMTKKSITIQIDVPSSDVGLEATPAVLGSISWSGVFAAAFALAVALASSSDAKIAAAIQALIDAVTAN